MVDSIVTPKVVFGDPITGIGSESTNAALSKYNHHDHAYIGSTSWLTLGVRPGDDVTGTTECDEAVFPGGTFIESMTESVVACTNAALLTKSPAYLSIGQRQVRNAVVRENSNEITLLPQHGFIFNSHLSILSNLTYVNTLFSFTAGDYPVFIAAPYDMYLVELYLVAPRSSCIAQVFWLGPGGEELNSTPTYNVSEIRSHYVYSEQAQTQHTSTFVAKGTRLVLRLSNVDNNTVLSYQTIFRKVLPLQL